MISVLSLADAFESGLFVMKCIVLLLVFCCSVAAQPTIKIKIDQVGYLQSAPKTAMVAARMSAGEFFVRRISDDFIEFKGKLGAPTADADSGDRVQIADFTRLEKSGEYYLDVPKVGRSWKFSIGKDVYARAFYLAMRSFYGQRCGIAVDLSPDFPQYKSEACHLKGAFHSSSGKTGKHVSAKGWHDAGDYGRYVVNSGISTGTLLWTYEIFGEKIGKINLKIPESGNGTPDILNEIRWNLDWMLAMQDADGGVFQKQTSENFSDFVMPEKDNSISYVIGTGEEPFKSSCATADFAAVTAIAARIYKPFDKNYTEKNLTAAQNAWRWLKKNPNVLYKNPKGILTGEYGDKNCGDERLWASAELWRTTGDEDYRRYFLENYRQYKTAINSQNPPSWATVAPFALWSYALGQKNEDAAAKAIKNDTVKAADEIVERTKRNGYQMSLTKDDYVWGSNAVAANYGMQLLVTNELKNDARYRRAAVENLHYLLGRNAFSLSFVTQLGENAFRNPHHRPSAADKNIEPYPGLLSGGPNRARQDPAMKKLPVNLPPAKMYLDEQDSYASNETAINWNAPLVFLLAGVQSEK